MERYRLNGKVPPVRVLVLVTGLPASGKSTLARRLAVGTDLPLLSLDVVKESLYDNLGAPQDRALLRAASLEAIWAVVPDCPRGALIDLWIDPVRDREAVRAALVRFAAMSILEVMCTISGDEAVRRYAARARDYSVHLPPDKATLDRIRQSAALIAPLELGPFLQVDTSRDVDTAGIAGWIGAHSRRADAGEPIS
jgi:predicted kinase